MKSSKKVITSLLLFFIIIFAKTRIDATYITISPANPKVGDSVTVTVTVPNVHTVTVTANVTGASTGVIKVVGGDLEGKAKDYSNSASFKCTKAGELKVSIASGSRAILDGKDVNVSATKTVNITEKEPTTSKPTATPTQKSEKDSATTPKATQAVTTTPTPTASSDATLKNLGITPNDFSGFKKTKTSYNVEVPNSTEKISIYAQTSNPKATVTGTGSKNLGIGKNTFAIKVTAEDKKTRKTYNLTITRKEKENEKEETSKQKDEQPKKEEDNLKENDKDDNSIENNTQNNSIDANIEESEDIVENNLIKDIKIRGYELTPTFSKNNNKYSVNIMENITKIDIEAEKANKNVEIEIAGNTNLKPGTNIITILATNNKDNLTETYQINAIVGEEKIDVKTFNYEVKQAQAALRNKTYIVQGGVVVIIVLTVIFIITKMIIKRQYKNEVYDEYDERDSSSEIEVPYSLYKNEKIEETKEVKKTRTKHKGKRFK